MDVQGDTNQCLRLGGIIRLINAIILLINDIIRNNILRVIVALLDGRGPALVLGPPPGTWVVGGDPSSHPCGGPGDRVDHVEF